MVVLAVASALPQTLSIHSIEVQEELFRTVGMECLSLQPKGDLSGVV